MIHHRCFQDSTYVFTGIKHSGNSQENISVGESIWDSFLASVNLLNQIVFCFSRFPSTEAVTRSCSARKVLLKISQISQENTCARVSFLRLWHRCFLVNFVKFQRAPFLTEHLRATVSEQTIHTKIIPTAFSHKSYPSIVYFDELKTY